MSELHDDRRDDQVEDPGARPVHVDTTRLIEAGLALWVLALIVILAVPALRTGERDWWPWVPVAGIALGALGRFYVGRGRGNAADA